MYFRSDDVTRIFIIKNIASILFIYMYFRSEDVTRIFITF